MVAGREELTFGFGAQVARPGGRAELLQAGYGRLRRASRRETKRSREKGWAGGGATVFLRRSRDAGGRVSGLAAAASLSRGVFRRLKKVLKDAEEGSLLERVETSRRKHKESGGNE